MQVPLRDLSRINGPIQEEIDDAIQEVTHGGQFILGDTVETFEEELAAYVGSSHAIGTGCATDALYLALQALGVEKGSPVMVPAFTLTPSVSGIVRSGAKPLFVDIDPRTYTIDPDALWKTLENCSRTPKALIVVHLYGQSADMDPIVDICKHYDVAIIEDCAQALGGTYLSRHGPRKVGSMGEFACFSFFPTKPLGGMGDGGAVVTNNMFYAESLRKLRNHGWDPKAKYVNQELGINSRLDAIQAAILSVKLPYLDDWISEVQDIAAIYDERLNHITPEIPFGRQAHAYHLYTIRSSRAILLESELNEAGVGAAKYFPISMAHQPVFEKYARDLPHTDNAVRMVLSLPIFPGMKPEEWNHVIDEANSHV